jgi:hypothetical protein
MDDAIPCRDMCYRVEIILAVSRDLMNTKVALYIPLYTMSFLKWCTYVYCCFFQINSLSIFCLQSGHKCFLTGLPFIASLSIVR